MSEQALEGLKVELRKFVNERDWEQFHSPKNLSMALIAECAELIEHFQWLTPEQSFSLSAEKHEQVRLELADIFIYLLRISDKLDVNLVKSAYDKIKINSEKYPAEKVKGRSHKYNEY